MGCIYIIGLLISPRLVLLGVWIFTDYVRLAFDSFLWPLLGLIFMPLLTLALVWGYNTEFGPLQVGSAVLGALFDLGVFGDAERRRRSRYSDGD